MFKTKTKTLIFVLEAPRDQDPGLEDYITGFRVLGNQGWKVDSTVRDQDQGICRKDAYAYKFLHRLYQCQNSETLIFPVNYGMCK